MAIMTMMMMIIIIITMISLIINYDYNNYKSSVLNMAYLYKH